MKGNSALYALAVVLLTATMAVAALAGDQGMNAYGPADSSMSNDVGTSGSQTDAWELREAMETGALPERSGSPVDSACCGGINGPTVESGGQVFRPDIDAGP